MRHRAKPTETCAARGEPPAKRCGIRGDLLNLIRKQVVGGLPGKTFLRIGYAVYHGIKFILGYMMLPVGLLAELKTESALDNGSFIVGVQRMAI